MARRKITWDDKELSDKLLGSEKRLRAFVYASCAYHGRRAQRWGRKNAKWTDRTSNARNGLFGKAFKRGDVTGFVFYGTVTYQPFLEVRFSGKYAIIGPTIRQEAPELMKTVSKGFDVVFGSRPGPGGR